LAIVAFDEITGGVAQLVDVAPDTATDDLLLEGAVEPLGDPVGLGLLDEGVGRLDAPYAICLVKYSERYWVP
jgi:hypothetical protein